MLNLNSLRQKITPEDFIKDKDSTTVTWESEKDEIYTYFGKCNSCGNNSIMKSSNYCSNCGKIIN